MTNSISERLKQLLEDKKCSRAELARFLNIHPSAVSNYLSGSRNPSLAHIKKMALFFNCSAAYISGLSDEREVIRTINDGHVVEFYKYAKDIDARRMDSNFTLPNYMLNSASRYIAVPCYDDALTDLGYMPGDLLIINASDKIESCQIGLFKYQQNYLVRKVVQKNKKLFLTVPNNQSEYDDIPLKDAICYGCIEYSLKKSTLY